MRNLTDEEKKNFLEWSEGNKYLYELLCTCWENEIQTYASCGGHEVEGGKPYIGIIINDNSFPFIESILAQIQDIPDIDIWFNARHSGNGQLYDTEILKSITFWAQKYNCCEMFYKMKKGIECKGKSGKLNSEAENFLIKVKKFKETSRKELQGDINNGISYNGTFCTKTQEFIDYENSKKLSRSSKIIRFLKKVLPFGKKDLKKYDELQQKYGFLQREYKEEIGTNLEQYRVENINTGAIVNVNENPMRIGENKENER